MKKLLSAAVLAGLYSSAAAAVDYSYLEAGYGTFKADRDIAVAEAFEPRGFHLNGSFGFADMFYVSAGYEKVGDDVEDVADIDATTGKLGFGVHFGITDKADFVAEVDYVDVEVDVDSAFVSADESDDGYALAVGLRGMAADNFELSGMLTRTELSDADDATESFDVKLTYKFMDNFGAYAGLRADLDGDGLHGTFIGARYSF